MKLFKLIVLSFFLFYVDENAQQLTPLQKTNDNNNARQFIDTSDFFPMQVGNYWEYAAITGDGYHYFGLTVVGDTILPNGKVFKIFRENDISKNIYPSHDGWEYYLRKDSNFVYYGFPYSICPEGEYLYLDFTVPDSTIWKVCRDNDNCGNARGAAGTYYDNTYYQYFQQPLETKKFVDVYTDLTDTIWVPCESYELWLSKGIGITRKFIFNDGDYHLRGAVINGVKYGVITGLEDEGSFSLTDFKIETYPNPFNSQTKIKFEVPTSSNIKISVYNVLGKEVQVLVNEYLYKGTYETEFEASDLSSGVYFYCLASQNFIETKKLVHIK